MYQTILEQIQSFSTIIIHRHNHPDGDALGSQLGLKEAILATFKEKSVFVVGDESKRLNWMGKMDQIDDAIYQDALVIVVDCGCERLISDERYKLGRKLIKIDHHIPQGEYGDIVCVNTNFESCAGLIADMIFKTKMKLNDDGASLLFTGIVTDSGRFRYTSTTSNTYKIVSKLMKYKIPTEHIYNKLYTEKLSNVKLKAFLTTKFQITEAGVAYLINTKEEIASYHVDIYDISRGMVNIMSGIEEIKIWVNFSETTDGLVYTEIRSNGYNINPVATYFGGGGHLQASGCTLQSLEQVQEVLEQLNQITKGENKSW